MANERKDIRTLSSKHKQLQTLINYVNKEALIKEHVRQSANKASGIDKVTKEEYGMNLENNIDNLMARMKNFGYTPQPVRRTYIPKLDGKLRPLGIPAYEDKLVQGVMAYILNEAYEPRFLECSYGFRPNKNCHMAIREINQVIMTKKVNYILDADIKGFFDNVEHEWLSKFLENDIGDNNFLRYIVRFLKSGIMEDMKFYESDKGTPQGGLISPALANVYLHYVLDEWFLKGIKPKLKGEAYLVRYADDFVIMFQYEDEAKLVCRMLIDRLKKFKLEIAEDKTRIIPFGRFKGTKDTFDFLGFTHINSKTKTGKYTVKHKTSKKKLKAKKEIAMKWLREQMHNPIIDIMATLNRKLIGHYNYYGVSGNFKDILNFYKYVKQSLYRILNRRHQKRSMRYKDYEMIWNNFNIRKPRICVNIW
ncbi:MAG: Group II intron-encoded protein LtrA [candidate division WS2 bacterium]|nr:Group II intron-encoded protein LtrA [Candidatus Psychracetigena formicireducens]